MNTYICKVSPITHQAESEKDAENDFLSNLEEGNFVYSIHEAKEDPIDDDEISVEIEVSLEELFDNKEAESMWDFFIEKAENKLNKSLMFFQPQYYSIVGIADNNLKIKIVGSLENQENDG